ncbi:MAG: rhodanese-like domain-containing protein [Actinomycetota bacterium]
MLPRDAFEKRAELRFLDVREPHEYEAGHIPGSVHIPLMSLDERVGELDADQTWIVTCQIGQRSDLAARFLRVRGFEAHNLDGGLERWTTEGLPLTTDGEEGRVADGEGHIIEWLPDS